MNDNKGACYDFKEAVELGDKKKSLQWINGKNDSYCMNYLLIRGTIVVYYQQLRFSTEIKLLRTVTLLLTL